MLIEDMLLLMLMLPVMTMWRFSWLLYCIVLYCPGTGTGTAAAYW